MVSDAAADLIHHIDGIAAVRVDGLIEGDRLHNGAECLIDRPFVQTDILGDLRRGGLPVQLGCQGFPGLHGLVGSVPQGTGDPHRVVIPEIAADLPDNHGDSIGGKTHVKSRVKVVDSFDEPDTAHLEQVIGIFTASGELLHHTQHQPEIPAHQLFPGSRVTLPCQEQEPCFFTFRQGFQPGGIDACDLHFVHLLLPSLLRLVILEVWAEYSCPCSRIPVGKFPGNWAEALYFSHLPDIIGMEQPD